MFEQTPLTRIAVQCEEVPRSLGLLRVFLLLSFLLLSFLLSAAATMAQGSTGEPGSSNGSGPALGKSDVASASLPLEEVLRLYRERDAAQQEKKNEAPPPVSGTVDVLAFSGRLLDEAMEVKAMVRLTLFEEDTWVQLPLLDLDAKTLLGMMPVGNDVFSLVVRDDRLVALAHKAGTRAFEISFLVRAEVQGDRRRISIRPAAATTTMLDLDIDGSHFDLIEVEGLERGDGFRVFPRQGRFDITWRRLGEAPGPEVEVSRVPTEPVIQGAHLSTVSTLEGDVHHRLLYDLSFEAREELVVSLPPEMELRKVFVHGRSVPFELDGNVLRLSLEPRRAGDRSGQLELLLRPAREAYHLSGELVLRLPSASWPIHHFYARLSLPEVFTYRWSGGSLSPVEEVPSVEHSFSLPTPGDELLYHQPLVHGSSPTLRVKYAIELEGRYFTGR